MVVTDTDVQRIDVTEVLDAPGTAGHDLVVTPHPLTAAGRVVLRGVMLSPGDTLASLLSRHGVYADQPGWVVRVAGLDVPVQLWARTRPKPGMLIEAHRVAGKGVLRAVALLALSYFTLGATSALGAGLAKVGITGLAAYGLQAGAFMLGSMVINKVLPPPGAGSYGGGERGTTYSLQGARNRARHWEPLGLLMGQVRVVPDFAAQPYSWFEGEDQYQYVQLHAGLNVHTVDELKIGATDIASYEGVTVTRSGFASGNGALLQWESVDTIAGGLLDAVSAPGPYVERNSSPSTVRLQVDLVGQLQYINSEGNARRFTVDLDMEFRLLPAGAWQPFVGATSSSVVQLANSTTKPLRRTFTRDVPAGQYAVRMRKRSQNETRTRAANVIEWAALKSYQADTGAAVARQVVGIKIKASGQINGVLDQVSWLATSKPVPVWNGSAWVTQVTSNPGALYLAFCRGETSGGRMLWGIGKPDDQIDIEGLKAWMVHCAAQGYRFDHWFDSAVSRADVLDAIAAAGLAARSYHTGKLGVVYMASGQPIEAVVTMGNIKRGSMRVDYATRVTAEEIEVASPERANGWLPASVRVLAPGVTMPRETARLSPAGVTTQAGRLLAARMAMAQTIYGRKSVSWEMDLEHLTVRRWSLVALSHDLTQWGYSGRLAGLAQNLCLWSEDLRNTAEAGSSRPWVQFDDTGGAVVVDLLTATPPAGTAAYSKLRAGTTGAVRRQLTQTISSVADGALVTVELLAKAGECQYLTVGVRTRSGLFPQVLFNVAAGTVQSTFDSGGAGIVGSITATEDVGWYRIQVRQSVLAGGTAAQVFVVLRTAANSEFSAATVGDGLFMTAVQLVLGGSVAAYARTTTTAAVALVLDAEVPAGASPHVGLRLPGEQAYRVFGVAAFTGTAHTLTLAEAWPAGVPLPGSSADNPAMDTLWVFDFTAQPGLRLRVVDIKPTPQLTGARITAVPEPDAFWTYIASGAYTAPAGTSGARAPVVTDLRAWAELSITATGDQVLANLTWSVSGDFSSALVMGAAAGQPLAFVATSYGSSWYGWEVERGLEYVAEVRPFDALGRPGAPVSITFQAAPIAREPADVIAFTALERESFGRLYYWDYNDFTPDLAGFEARYVDAAITGATWEQMAPLFEAGRNDRSASVNLPADGTWIIAIRAVDVAGNTSLRERRATVSFDQGSLGAPVLSVDCGAGGWPGTLTNCGIRDYYLIDKGVTTWATLPSTWADWTTWQGAAHGSITYQHSTLDLGSSAARRIRAGHVAAGSVTTEYQSSTDGVTYTAWAALPSAPTTFRYIRVRWTVTGDWPTLYRAQFRIYL